MNLTTNEGASGFLCAQAKTTTTPTAGTVIESINDLDEGVLVLVDENNEVLDASTSANAGKVRFVVNRYGELRYSDFIGGGKMLYYSGQDDAAPTYQITYLGYNGTSGSMDSDEGVEYKIRLLDNSSERIFSTKEMYNLISYVANDATQENVATGLHAAAVANSVYGEPFIKAELVCSGTSAFGTGGQAKVAYGSKTVINSGLAGLSPNVGDFLRFNGASTDSAVYKVVSIDTNGNFILHAPYQGLTKNLDGTADIALIAAASAGDFGLKFSTRERKYFKPGTISYISFAFDLGYTNFTVATVSTTSHATAGHGTYEQMAELEWYQEGHAGSSHRDAGALDYWSMNYLVERGHMYNQLLIGFFDQGHLTAIGQDPKSGKHLTVAFDSALGATDASNVAIKAMDAFAVANGYANSGIAV